MKRHALTLVLTGVLGSLVAVGNAEACHKKKCACPAPAPVCAVEPAPCPAPAPVCEPTCAPAPKKCGLFSHVKLPKFGGLCHKKAAACTPAPAPCAETIAYTPAPVYATTQAPVYATGQASAQH